jgi:hypothetical protein
MEPVHLQILDAACAAAARDWTFGIAEITAALPHLNAATVRTHVASRCCANAPANHQTRYRYFRTLQRGLYRVEPSFRRRRRQRPTPSQDRILSSIDSGVDSTLIEESLALTATERLDAMQQAARALEPLRPAFARTHPRALRRGKPAFGKGPASRQ